MIGVTQPISPAPPTSSDPRASSDEESGLALGGASDQPLRQELLRNTKVLAEQSGAAELSSPLGEAAVKRLNLTSSQSALDDPVHGEDAVITTANCADGGVVETASRRIESRYRSDVYWRFSVQVTTASTIDG